MSTAERIIGAIAWGLLSAAIMYAASVALGSRMVWPGTIMAFAMMMQSALFFLRR